MNIEVLKYTPTKAPLAFAYVDLQIGPLRFNGVNLRRDGTITGGMLTFVDKRPKDGKLDQMHRPSVELAQDHPWIAEIRAAIELHTAKMPPHVKAPPAWTPEEIEAKKQSRLNYEQQQKAKGAKIRAANDAVKRAAKASVPVPWRSLPPEERERIKQQHRAKAATVTPPPAPPPRAKIEPGKPLIQRPPLRKQG